MNFIGSASRRRAKQFDTQLATTIDILSRPEVSVRVGYMAATLIRSCSQAFLPNMHHGVARLPKEQDGSDNIAFLPLLRSDGATSNIRLSRALTAPSVSAVINAAHKADMLPANVRGDYLRQAPESTSLGVDLRNALTMTPRMIITPLSRPQVLVGRSIITTISPNPAPEITAETNAHEFLHAVDAQTHNVSPATLLNEKEKQRHQAAKEYRGYRISQQVLSAFELQDHLKDEVMAAWDEFDLHKSDGWNVPDAAVNRAVSLGIIG